MHSAKSAAVMLLLDGSHRVKTSVSETIPQTALGKKKQATDEQTDI